MTTVALASTWERLLEQGPPRPRNEAVAIIDIGSSKICCYIAARGSGGGIKLLGRGYQASAGFRGGELVDVEAAENAILRVVHEAEQASGELLRTIAVSWSGGVARSELVRVDRHIGGGIVGPHDVRDTLLDARQLASVGDREVIHVLPLEFSIGGTGPLRDPVGKSGDELQGLINIVSVAGGPLRELRGCIERCHLELVEIISSAYAAGIACLTEDEGERGCLVIDIGAQNTGMAYFFQSRATIVDHVSRGGEHVTRDLAYGLTTSRNFAERIKSLYGSVQWRSCDDSIRIPVPIIGDHVERPTGEVSRTRITHIMRARIEEIFELVRERLQLAKEARLAKGPQTVVLTGGSAQIDGIDEFAEEFFGIPARIGRPSLFPERSSLDESPCCSAAAGGLALLAGDDGGLGWKTSSEAPMLSDRLTRLKQWFKENFVS